MDRIALSVTEAASATGVSRSTAYSLVRAGVWPSVQVNSLIRVPADELRKWLTENTTGGSGAPTLSDRHRRLPTFDR